MSHETVDSLVLLADGILADADLREGLLDRIEAYADQFADWYDGIQAVLEQGDIGEDLENKLRNLLKKHEEVLSLAESLRGDVSADLRSLKKRGKGIMAYVDVLPKKMTTRTKKG